MAKEVSAVLGGKGGKGLGGGLQKTLPIASCGLAQERFEFGKGHFDGIEVRAISGQITQVSAAGRDGFADPLDLV
jgi:hypothetical protein